MLAGISVEAAQAAGIDRGRGFIDENIPSIIGEETKSH